MAYSLTVPTSADKLRNFPAAISANWTAINDGFDTEHNDLLSGSPGTHKFVTLPEQAVSPTTAANQGALFTQEVSGVTQLFFRPESDGTIRRISAPVTDAASGSTALFGGLIIKWGVSNVGLAATTTISFAGGAFPSTCYSVVASYANANLNLTEKLPYLQQGQITASSFKVVNPAGGQQYTCTYIAIGK
jgi:hypothetical protein